MEEQRWLVEALKTVTNLEAVAQLLIKLNYPDLLPTILELMLIECQDIVDECCVIRS